MKMRIERWRWRGAERDGDRDIDLEVVPEIQMERCSCRDGVGEMERLRDGEIQRYRAKEIES